MGRKMALSGLVSGIIITTLFQLVMLPHNIKVPLWLYLVAALIGSIIFGVYPDESPAYI